jgi:vitamin B12 transporter
MRRIHIFASLLALSVSFSTSSDARADDSAQPAAEPPLIQDPIVVTPTRVPEQESESLAPVSVVTREDIESSQARDVVDLLRLLPGIDIARTGGAGQQTSVFLRGTNSNQTLVLIDGVRANSAGTGSFTWENLPVSQIERIEIVRGPRSSYYGSDAIGGVIQIFTRRVSGGNFRVELGSFNSYAAEAGFGLGSDELFITLNAATLTTDGFSAQNQNGFSFDPDDDGYDNTSLTLGIDAETGRRSEFNVKLFWSEGDVEFDQGASETRNTTVGADWTLNTDNGNRHRFGLGLESDDIETPVFGSQFETDRVSFDYFYDRPVFTDGVFSAGLNYVDEEAHQFDAFNGTNVYDQKRDFVGIFAALAWRSGINDIQISGRFDDYSDFGSEPTVDLAWGLSLSERAQLIFSLGSAFRAPNFNELFSPGFGGLFAGNPALRAETSTSFETDFRYRLSEKQRFNANLFFSRIDNLIAFQGVDFRAINIDEAEIDGLELSYALSLESWNIGASATLQSAKDADTGMKLLRRAHEKASLRADWLLGNGGNIGGELFFSGEREDFGATLDSYVLVNLRARIPLARTWTLEARVENLMDEEYELAAGFNTPERSGYVGVRWTPGGTGG